MRIRSKYLRTALSLATAVSLQVTAGGSAAASLCDGILGDWAWFLGGKVTFSNGAHVRWTPGVAGAAPAAGTWSCAPGSGTYTVTWQNGFIDTLHLSADRSQLSGTSSTGAKVSGQRMSSATSEGATSTRSVTPAPPNQRLRCPGCPIGPDGMPQRIGPQGKPPPKGAG